MTRRKKKTLIIVFVILFILVSAFYNGIVVRKYVISTSDFSDPSHIRMVLIADLHSCFYGKNQSILLRKIQKQKPGVIFLVGDIADDVTPFDGAELLVKELVKMAPCYYVTGNHEFCSGKAEKIKKTFENYGVITLEQQICSVNVDGQKINICGVDDPYVLPLDKRNEYSKLLYNFRGLPADEFNILLAHRPEYIEEYKKYEFDLVLSGHAHGGQCRIPFVLNGLYAPNQGFFPKYAGGIYRYGTLSHVVSRGLSFNAKLPRIYNPPELVVIDVLSEGQSKQ